MASVTYIVADGERAIYGIEPENAEVFYDRSGNTLVRSVPSGGSHSFDVDTTARLTVSATLVDVTGTLTASGLVTASAALTVTTGDLTVSAVAAALVLTAGNVEAGNPGAFVTTQPQGALVMGGTSLNGIAPAGNITTAAAIFASDTVVRKIIAASTVTDVET